MKTLIERCEHHGEDLVLYCPKCRPSHAELQARIEKLEGDLMTCKQTRGAAISREKEAAQNMSAIAKENKRLYAALAKYTDEIFECENNEDFHGHTIITVEDKRKARAGE